jgi:CIC family chloride channel protein
MTGNYDLLVPAMLVCLISFLLCRDVTLYRQQLASRLDAPSKVGHMARAILRRVTVGDALALKRREDLTVVPEGMPFIQLVDTYTHTHQPGFPVVDTEGRLTGMLDAEDLREMLPETGVDRLVIAGDIQQEPVTISPRETVLAAINTMVRAGREVLIVMDQEGGGKPVAVLSRGDVIHAYNHAVADVGPPIP